MHANKKFSSCHLLSTASEEGQTQRDAAKTSFPVYIIKKSPLPRKAAFASVKKKK